MNKEIQDIYFYDNYPRFSEATTRTYRMALKQFFSFCAKPLDQIEAPDIQAWLHSMEARGLKPHSVRTQLSAVKSFYHYCMEENKLKRNPSLSVKLDKIELPIIESRSNSLSQQEIILLQVLTSTDTRVRALIELLCTTSVRVRDLLNVKLDDVNWEDRQFRIGWNHSRFYQFTHECSVLLKAYLNERMCESEYLFCKNNGEKLDLRRLQFQFEKYSKALGFKVSPNALQDSFAANLAEEKMQ